MTRQIYDTQLWDAAMELSAALEGNQARFATKYMLAETLLASNYKFKVSLGNLGWRERSRLQKEINMVVKHHEGQKHVQKA